MAKNQDNMAMALRMRTVYVPDHVIEDLTGVAFVSVDSVDDDDQAEPDREAMIDDETEEVTAIEA